MAVFNVGDLVMLDIEGAPCMTVVTVRNNDVTCRWFGSDNTLHEHTFPAAELLPEVKHAAAAAAPAYHTKTTAHHEQEKK